MTNQTQTVTAEMMAAQEAHDPRKGSVVPLKYKALYLAAGHPDNCGDWLARTMDRFCKVRDERGKEITDIAAVQAIAEANGVTISLYGKLGVETNGWQGRYRMTVRNMLTRRCAAAGQIVIPANAGSAKKEETIRAPKAWCAQYAPKAPKPKAKKAA